MWLEASACIPSCMHTRIQTYIHTYMAMACMHAHARTYIHTCMPAHEQTYTHACRGSAGEGGAASGEAARLLPFGEAASGEAARNEYGAMLCLAVLCHAVPYADSLAVPCCAVCRQICTHMLCRAMPCYNMLCLKRCIQLLFTISSLTRCIQLLFTTVQAATICI